MIRSSIAKGSGSHVPPSGSAHGTGQCILLLVSFVFFSAVGNVSKLTADPGVASSIPARSHTFVEIDHEIISTVILLPSAESLMKGCCHLQAKVCARLLVNCLFKLAQEKSVVR